MNDINTSPFSQVTELMARRKAAGEDEWNVANAALRDAETELEKAFDHSEHGAEARRMHAEIAMTMERWRAAIERWTAILIQHPGMRDYCLCRSAAAHRRLGNMIEARETLNSVSDEYRKLKRYINEDRRVKVESDNWSAIQLAFSAFDRLANEGDFKGARAMVMASAVLRRFSEDDIAALERMCQALQAFYDGKPLPVAAGGARHPRKFVAIGGFGWSGSGAVADFLHGSAQVAFPTGNTEVTLFEGESRGGYNAQQLLRASRQAPDVWRRAVAIFIFWTVFGLAFPPAKRAQAQRWHRKSLKGCAVGPLDGIVEPVFAFLALCSVPRPSRTALARAIANIFERAVGSNIDPSVILVLNNCIHAKNMAILRRLEDAVGFAIVRDPRDQFVARATENTRYVIKVENFIAMLKRDRQKYAGACRKDAIAKRINQIRFEDFVTRPELRAQVARLCGVDPDPLEGSAKFDAAKSARNVGIHRHYKNQKAIAAIAAAFPDLLWHGDTGLAADAMLAPQADFSAMSDSAIAPGGPPPG